MAKEGIQLVSGTNHFKFVNSNGKKGITVLLNQGGVVVRQALFVLINFDKVQ